MRPQAEEDLDSQLDYYVREAGLDVAMRYLGGIERAIHFLYLHPDAGSSKDFGNPALKGLRSWPVPGFEEIRIYYLRPDENTIRIVRILHGKRDLAGILN